MGDKILSPILTIHPDLFTCEECRALVSLSETLGFTYVPIQGKADFPRDFSVQNGRDNERAAIEDCNLAEALWQRVKPIVPDEIDGKMVVGLNERLRFYRYKAGQSFTAHRDGYFLRENRERSLLTLILYLNDDYTGGETRFLESENLIIPQQGQVIVFSHQLWHEGLPVTKGCKYVLRTDVIYQM